MLGGYITQHYGWRNTFIIFGLSGLFIVPLAHFILKEPRKLPQFAVRAHSVESMMDSMRALLAKPAYVYVVAGIVIYFLMAYGALVFIVSMMVRVHGLNVAQAGAIFGGAFAAGSMLGSLAGGWIADRFAARDMAWLPRIGGWGIILAVPFYELALWAPDVKVMTPLLVVAATMLSASIPAAFASIHVVCGSKRRALSVAMMFFLANLIGLGLGPVVAGALSDYFGATHGPAEGLRLALMLVMLVLFPAGWLMLRAARYFGQDAED
jgi:MFS family permease